MPHVKDDAVGCQLVRAEIDPFQLRQPSAAQLFVECGTRAGQFHG
jgi:hypothetical protein